MTYDPNTRTTEREVIVTPQGPSYGGPLLAGILIVLVILGAVWLFTNDGADTTGTTAPTETTVPVETTIPTDTTAPGDAVTTTAP